MGNDVTRVMRVYYIMLLRLVGQSKIINVREVCRASSIGCRASALICRGQLKEAAPRLCWPAVLAAKESTAGDEVSGVAGVRSDQVGGFVRRKGGEKSRGSVEWRTPIRGARSLTTAGRWRRPCGRK